MDNIGELLLDDVGLVGGDLACGTTPWAMRRWGDIILAMETVGGDCDGMVFIYRSFGDVGGWWNKTDKCQMDGGGICGGGVARLFPSGY